MNTLAPTVQAKNKEEIFVPEATPNWELEFLEELTGLTAEQILNLDLNKLVKLNRIILFYYSF